MSCWRPSIMHHHQISLGTTGMVSVRTVTPGLGPHLCIVVVGKAPGCMLIMKFVSLAVHSKLYGNI